MKLAIVLLIVAAIAISANAQPFLKPHIGLTIQPQSSDPICTIPLYLGDFDNSGYQLGDTVNDFTLYNLPGDSLRLSASLQNNKPKLFISSSYTCPVFRNHVPQINDLVATYGSYVDIYVIYTVEAHPDSNSSPYFGYVNVTTQNINAGILYHQPETYGERVAIVQEMLLDMTLNAPVFIDGPCNDWWLHYGPAPNNATLIGIDGTVKAKHGWFNQFPDNMGCDIDSLLGLSFTNCGTVNNNGSFTFTMVSGDTAYGNAGDTHSLEAILTNPTAEDVIVDIKRIEENIPAGWATALCLDVCYPASVDTAWVLISAGESQTFHFYFFTDTAAGFGAAKIGFRNREHPNNAFTQFFYSSTSEISTVIAGSANDNIALRIFPNPANTILYVSKTPIRIYDSLGKLWLTSDLNLIDISSLPSGIYTSVHDTESKRFVRH